jgi:cytochrome c-type biogenesis protein CcmE
MTLDFPAPRNRRWGVVLAAAVVAGAIGWLAFSGIGNALVYYRTPTELTALGEQGMGRVIRLGGLVLPDSLACADGGVNFVVTDGDTQIPVHGAAGNGLLCPREGVGVVVEGRLSTLGVFEPTQVIVKHDENYVAPSQGALPSHLTDPGT